MTGLSPTVTGALIAGGAALIGFGAAALQNAYTVRANRTSAREQRLWEKRCVVYEEVMQAISRVDRIQLRQHRHTSSMHDALTRHLGAMHIYASEPAFDAYENTLFRLMKFGPRPLTLTSVREDDYLLLDKAMADLSSAIREELQAVPPPGIRRSLAAKFRRRRERQQLQQWLSHLD